MIRRPPRSTLFPTRRSSDLNIVQHLNDLQKQNPERKFANLKEATGTNNLAKYFPFFPEAKNELDRKSTRLNSSHGYISYAVFCLKKKKKKRTKATRLLSTA